MGTPTFQELSDFVHVVLQVMADGGEQVIIGVQVGDDLIAIVEVVGAMVVHIIHRRLQETGKNDQHVSIYSIGGG